MKPRPWKLEWKDGADVLGARETSCREVARHARALAGWYNEDHNRSMLDHAEKLAPADVRQSFRDMRRSGRVFLLYFNGELMGDADFRGIRTGTAEFAIMIGPRSSQGKGLGTRFSILMHAFAFRVLHAERVYLTIVAGNAAGKRCYEKVGYVVDESPAARAYADAATDVAMSLTREEFERRHAAALAQIQIARG